MRNRFLILAIGFVLTLSACQQTAAPTDSPNVLGIGTVTIGAGGVTTASLADSAFTLNAGIEITNDVFTSQTTFNDNNIIGNGRVERVQVGIRNTSGADIENLVLLAISLVDLDQSVSPFSNVREFPSNAPITDASRIAQIKPVHGFTLDETITTADFVAYAESDLSESVRNAVQRAVKVPVAAVMPYGFKVGDIANQGTANVDIAFLLPNAAAINGFTFRFVAVEDTLERYTQGVTEIALNDTTDTAYSDGAGVRQRYGAVDAGKTLVLMGPYTRTVAQSDLDANIFTLLPDIRIMGTADNPTATLLDSGSSDLPTLITN